MQGELDLGLPLSSLADLVIHSSFTPTYPLTMTIDRPPFRTHPCPLPSSSLVFFRRIPLPQLVGADALLSHPRCHPLPVARTGQDCLWSCHPFALHPHIDPRVKHHQAQGGFGRKGERAKGTTTIG
jgi:hypothetical protein